MKQSLFPRVLIISNRYDFSSDFISVELNRQKIPYLRINRDELKDYTIEFNPIIPIIKDRFKDIEFTISNDNLKSVYYRAPTFLRDIFQDNISDEEQLIRSQWTAFVRSICVFENINQSNNPVDIYKAEIKPYQLFIANKIGFKVPETLISNETKKIDSKYIEIKSIDTAIINLDENEGFGIRIEDNVVIQEQGEPFNLMKNILIEVDEIEDLMNES